MNQKSRPSLVGSSEWVLENLQNGAAGYLTAADSLARSLGHLPRAQKSGSDPDAIIRHRLANHAANDGLELLQTSLLGAGRSMLRSARSLFEVAVATRDVLGSPALMDRYLAHDVVGKRTGALLTRVDPFFSPKGRRSLRHRRRTVVRDADVALSEGVARWGPRWKVAWAPTSLRERASSVGLLEDYDTFYRFASLPTHASAGGLAGTFDAELGPGGVHRYGPAFQLCPVALIYGLVYLQMAAEAIGPMPDVQPVIDAIKDLQDEIISYGAVVLYLDDSLWPIQAPPDRIAVVSIYQRNMRWFVHDLVMEEIADAITPDLSVDQSAYLEQKMAEHASGPLSISTPLIIGMYGLTVHPKPGATWVRDTDVLPMRPLFGGLDPRSEFDFGWGSPRPPDGS